MNYQKIRKALSLILFTLLALVYGNDLLGEQVNDSRQSASPVDVVSLAQQITKNSGGDHEKVMALYRWVADNIVFDMDPVACTTGASSADQMVQQVLTRRMGVCQHFALLMDTLCGAAGIESYVVSGLTRSTKDISSNGHVWNVLHIHDHWYVCDATWGSGYVKDGRFVHQVNMQYLFQSPQTAMKTYFPFDPLWQMVDVPVTFEQFKADRGVFSGVHIPQISEDSLLAYNQLSYEQQVLSTLRRMKEVKDMHPVIKGEYAYQQELLHVMHFNRAANVLNRGASWLNEAVDIFNEYVDSRNSGFTSPRITPHGGQAMLDSCEQRLLVSVKLLDDVEVQSHKMQEYLDMNRMKVDQLQDRIRAEKRFLNTQF